MNTYVCTICGYVYEEAAGIPASGIAPGTVWKSLPSGWVCPLCGAARSQFQKREDTQAAPQEQPLALDESALGGMTTAQLAAICSNLGRGCEKQYLNEEAGLFRQLSDYFTARIPAVEASSTQELLAAVQQDLEQRFPRCHTVSKANGDRGALRALTWSEKVSRILSSILERVEQEGEAALEHTNIYVCEVCGFLYIGDEAPELCPVCKVPGWKLQKLERR